MEESEIRKSFKIGPEDWAVLDAELAWLRLLVKQRFEESTKGEKSSPLPLPPVHDSNSHYASFLARGPLALWQRLAVLLGLANYLQPDLFDAFLAEQIRRQYRSGGWGLRSLAEVSGAVPSIQTLVFLVCGSDQKTAIQLRWEIENSTFFLEQGLLRSMESDAWAGNPVILPGREILFRIFEGESPAPGFGDGFPAQEIKTRLDWEDLVLPNATLKRIQEVLDWIRLGEQIMKDPDLGRRLKPGYRALFYGPPGTGKSMTASLIGKTVQKSVYRIDLSQVVSKYIGETEKNLASVFDSAQDKNWILFFDEADALFGKRTQTRQSNDRYANQEVSYLLQRVEDFPGVVILASNFRGNIDQAFARRFQNIIPFSMPDTQHRIMLWEKALPKSMKVERGIELKILADRYKVTGADIMNVIHFASLQAFARGDKVISEVDIIEGLSREYDKEGKVMNKLSIKTPE